MAVSLMLVLSVLGAARARPEMRTPGAAVATRAPVPKPAFSFAPLGGQGMGAACACTTPTGSRGEALTLTRASSGFCNKNGLGTTGISNGDLVQCSTDQPRVQPGVPSGPLGLLVEAGVTNTAIRSQELDNLTPWANYADANNATRTANYGVAPDGTATAERIEYPARTGTSYTSLLHSAACTTGGARTFSIYARAVSGTPVINLCMSDGAAWQRAACTATTTGWTRCSLTVTVGGGGGAVQLSVTGATATGCTSGANMAAADVLLWGGQCEAGSYATSYIPTAGGSAARAGDNTSIATTTASVPGGVGVSIAPEWTGTGPTASTSYAVDIRDPTYTNGLMVYQSAGGIICQNYNGANPVTASASASAHTRYWCWADTSGNTKVGGRLNSTALTVTDNVGGATVTSGILRPGAAGGSPGSAGDHDAVLFNICADPNIYRCQ